MLKIRRDSDIFEVTKGVYEDTFKPLGYEIVKENKQKEEKVEEKDFNKNKDVSKNDKNSKE